MGKQENQENQNLENFMNDVFDELDLCEMNLKQHLEQQIDYTKIHVEEIEFRKKLLSFEKDGNEIKKRIKIGTYKMPIHNTDALIVFLDAEIESSRKDIEDFEQQLISIEQDLSEEE